MRDVFLKGLFVVMTSIATPLLAQQDCATTVLERGPNALTGSDCTINWIENNRLRTLTWRAVMDDFEQAQLVQGPTGPVLIAAALPNLVDVDQDGWLDNVTFTPVAMVNGTFDIFFYEPGGGLYGPVQSLFGHTLSRDDDGYLIVAGRSGPGTVLRFYAVVYQALTFQFEIDPFALDPVNPDGPFICEISATNSSAENLEIGILPDDPALVAYYCDTDPVASRQPRDIDLGKDDPDVDRVTSGTVFYCRLEGGTHTVTIAQSGDRMTYAYGRRGQKPELLLERRVEQVGIMPLNGTGPYQSGVITFVNGAYAYTAFYTHEKDDADNTMQHGLTVTKDGDIAKPVFAKLCLPAHTYDAISALSPR